MKLVVVTVVRGRHDHLANQHLWLARGRVVPDHVVVVSLADEEIARVVDAGPMRDRAVVVPLPVSGPLPLAEARNRGAQRAWQLGADVCVFLDVDCLPGPGLLEAYATAHQETAAPAVLCGPVSYLPPPGPDGYDEIAILSAEPHAARPAPPDGAVERDDRWELFWSLSFALDRLTWDAVGWFDERYLGYGAEDTDFGQRARHAGAELLWVGGARAYHQWHPVSQPPVEHLDDIVVNANRFREVWGWFPMTGWLEEFARRGLAELDETEERWVVVAG
jgi:hypothetical protein